MRPQSKRLLLWVVLPLALVSAWAQFAPRQRTGGASSKPVEQARHEAEAAVAKLQGELEKHPNPAGWAALGAAQSRLGQWHAALETFNRVGATLDARADWLSTAAEAGFHAHGRRFDALARARLDRALALDPSQPAALTLAATDAMQRADWDAAIALWQRLLPLLPAHSEDARAVEQALRQAQEALQIRQRAS